MKKQIIIPFISVSSIVVGAILLNNGTAIVLGGVLLMAGMLGSFYSFVKYKK